MLEYLAALDIRIFRMINTGLSCKLLDWTMPVVTDLHKSIPAVAIGALAVVFWIAKGRKRALAIIAVIVFAAAFADLLNAFTMKTQFRRDRPFQSLPEVKLRAPASGFSFPSNHATNCFTVATVIAFAYPPLALISYLVALVVAFSRVYVGVHFPFDVMASAITGIGIGSSVWWLGKGTVEKVSESNTRFRHNSWKTRKQVDHSQKETV